MKANFRLRPALASAVLVTVLACGLASGGCSSQRPAPPPPPVRQPAPRPAPPPAPLPRSTVDWRQAPLTPGDWAWSAEGGQSVARFAGGQLVLRCDGAARRVTMLRAGTASAPVAMSVSTSAMTRALTGSPIAGPPPALAVEFAAGNRLLDAMAFSRGRFAVETAGLATLYVPSWTEVTRVIEDCR